MRTNSIAIIGGGPSGATLGWLLAKEGCKVAIFHNDKRPPILVGESLLPAIIPMLRTLGIEDQIKSFSIYKPGATVCLTKDEIVSTCFRFAEGKLPDYAYNTPRDLFDSAVLDAAKNAGAAVFPFAAKLERADLPDTVRLTEETISRAEGFFNRQPDLIVDATGRTRLISRLLEIPIQEGPRKDVALFAHLSDSVLTDQGHIHLDYLTKGWSWRIPLPGRISLGIVINPEHLAKYGADIEKQFDGYMREEPSLRFYSQGATRLTPVLKFNNYQIVPQRLYGPGWVMMGDAAGFIDPIFSSGLYLGMKSAFELFRAMADGSPGALQRYQTGRFSELLLWQRVIDTWYDGRLFNLFRAGQKYRKLPMGGIMERRVRKRLARILSGEAADDVRSMKVFGYLMKLGAAIRDPSDLRIV